MGLPPPLGRVAKPDACPASSAGTSEDKFSALDARTAPSHLPRPRSTRTLTALIRIQARYLSPMTTLRPASTRPPVLVISRFSVCANPARPTSRRSASAVPERGELGGVLCRFAFSASAAAAEPPRPCRNLGRNKWGGGSGGSFARGWFRASSCVGTGGSQGGGEPCGVLCRFSLGRCGEAPQTVHAHPARFCQLAVRKAASAVLILEGLGGSATFFKTRDAVLSTRRGADKAERAAAAAAAGAGSGLAPSPAFLASVAPRVSHHAHHVLYGFGFRLR